MEKQTVNFSIDVTRAQLRAALIFAGDRDIRYYLNGVCLHVGECGDARLESALKAHGWSVARYPRSAEQRAKLCAQGYEPTIQTAPGLFEPHPLGLAWAKPGKASGEAPKDDSGMRFSVGGVEFEAIRYLSPRPHWRPKVLETGEIFEGGVFKTESRPKMIEDIEYFFQRIGKNDPQEFRRRLGLHGESETAQNIAAIADTTGAPAVDAAPAMQAADEVAAESCATLIPGRWIPNGAENAERIAFDAALGAEVWLIASTRQPGQCAVIAYAGKRTKQDAHYTMRDREQALTWAGEYMGKQQATAQRQAERRAEKAAKRAAGHKLKPGDVLRSSWGYDQTNIDYYEVTKLIGTRMVEIRAIGAESVNDGGLSMTGDCVPRPGHYIGEPMRKAVSDHDGQSVRIASYAHANKIEPREVAGVKVWPVDHWTAYA